MVDLCAMILKSKLLQSDNFMITDKLDEKYNTIVVVWIFILTPKMGLKTKYIG